MSDAAAHANQAIAAAGEPLLVFLVLSLAIGAGVRHLLRGTKLPYTVCLLVAGLALGMLERGGLLGGRLELVSESLAAASLLDPHLILFIFLPPLIFESAFSLDKHVFRRVAGQALLLAVPGLLLSTAGIAVISKMLFPWNWSWFAALMFGALLSATDPVAVVALLRELGAGRGLATLLEGESLLNDGTAIVVFTVFYTALITGGMGGAGHAAMSFMWVTAGGLLIGIAISVAFIEWIRRVFNDEMVEITLTIIAAYLTFFIAEKVFHTSGVLALVALGLILGGPGRTRISPEVEGFLHHFWEMMAYLANTLIFILVGVVIARHAWWTDAASWLVLLGLYLAIHVVRAAVTLVFMPLLKSWGYGLRRGGAAVLVWGGLRGAVSMCLALAVAQETRITGQVGAQVLFLTAGIVVMTLVINGTSIRGLIAHFGLDRIAPARAFALKAAFSRVEDETAGTIRALRDDRFLRSADWPRVREYLPSFSPPKIAEERSGDPAREARKRVLEVEKHSYWRQFHQGLIRRGTVGALMEAADSALDRGGSLTDRRELDLIWAIPPALGSFQAVPGIGRISRYFFFDRLYLAYNTARAFAHAQEEAKSLLPSIVPDGELAAVIAGEIEESRAGALKAVSGLQEAFPGMVRAVETRTAAGVVLLHERTAINRLVAEGVLDEEEAKAWIARVEARMKQVFDTPRALRLPEPGELLKETPWLAGVDDSSFDRVLAAVKERLYPAGELIFREGDEGTGLFIVARGAVRVFREEGRGETLIDIMGPGSVIGEMAVLMGLKRTASVRAQTPVATLWLPTGAMQSIMDSSPDLKDRLWHTAGMRLAENLLILREPFRSWGRIELHRCLEKGRVEEPSAEETVRLEGPAVLLAGEALEPAEEAPALITAAEARFKEGARVFLCPRLDPRAGP